LFKTANRHTFPLLWTFCFFKCNLESHQGRERGGEGKRQKKPRARGGFLAETFFLYLSPHTSLPSTRQGKRRKRGKGKNLPERGGGGES